MTWAIILSLRLSLNALFSRAVSDPIKHLYQIFDLEKALTHFCHFKVVNGKLVANREDGIKWEVDGATEFKSLFEVLCNLPHVRALADANDTLQLFPDRCDIVFNRLKVTLEKMVWFCLGSCFNLFVDHKGNFVQEFKESNLISMSADSVQSLDQWFNLEFASGVVVKAMLHEENFFASFYNNQIVFESLDQELCISLDVALAGSGCEVIVEGFYSVVAAHKKKGGQGNTGLIERAVVDWCIPDPITCPETMKKIAHLYTEGDKKLGIARHCSAELFDERGRAREKHKVSKVVDRLIAEKPRCPHVIQGDTRVESDSNILNFHICLFELTSMPVKK